MLSDNFLPIFDMLFSVRACVRVRGAGLAYTALGEHGYGPDLLLHGGKSLNLQSTDLDFSPVSTTNWLCESVQLTRHAAVCKMGRLDQTRSIHLFRNHYWVLLIVLFAKEIRKYGCRKSFLRTLHPPGGQIRGGRITRNLGIGTMELILCSTLTY